RDTHTLSLHDALPISDRLEGRGALAERAETRPHAAVGRHRGEVLTVGAHILQPTFTGGELSPSLYARVDLARYGTSVKTGKNFRSEEHTSELQSRFDL